MERNPNLPLFFFFFPQTLPLWAKIVIPVGSWILIPFVFYGTVIFVERGRNIFLSLKPLFLACFNTRAGKELKHQREDLKAMLRTLVEMVRKIRPQTNPSN